MEEKNTVLFDPGYAPLVVESIGQVGYSYYMFSACESVKIKKINFPAVAKKIEQNLKINVAFYLGCILWACYISQFDNYKIEGNKLLGEVCEQSEYTDEISFLIDLIEKTLPRDYKYYLNKHYNPDSRYLPVLKAYKEFLIINSGFTSCSLTNQIRLPESVKKLSKDELIKIYENIQNAILKKDITLLFDSYDFLFN